MNFFSWVAIQNEFADIRVLKHFKDDGGPVKCVGAGRRNRDFKVVGAGEISKKNHLLQKEKVQRSRCPCVGFAQAV